MNILFCAILYTELSETFVAGHCIVRQCMFKDSFLPLPPNFVTLASFVFVFLLLFETEFFYEALAVLKVAM